MPPCTPPLELADRQKIFDGSDPVKMHNYYTYLYNQTVHDVISAKKGEKEAILFARSATAGGQKFPVHWGDSLLVAPIFNDQSMAEYYLPAGTWTSVLTGEARQGGKWYREKHGYLSIPLYARENSILALGARDDDTVYDYADGMTLNVYALQDGATAQTVVYSPDNQASCTPRYPGRAASTASGSRAKSPARSH